MEGREYPAHVINTSTSTSYPSPGIPSPNNPQDPGTHALPPIQSHQAAMQPIYPGGHPHTPRTPQTPNTPASATNLPSYSQPTSQRPIYAMTTQGQYPPPPQAYGTSAGMMPQATTAASHPQPIAPAPPSGGRSAPVLRPTAMPHPAGMGAMMGQAGLPEGEPTHVVGSQGRRGILPSEPGRPSVAQISSKGAIAPVKDADGKFPCPHCAKTYLHAKHLKRHLLRHTGDRPYRCVLCTDTFSRSDILKRHFQKCSIRRGNPTGASHLSHPQAHVKKSSPGQKPPGAMGAEGDMNHLNGLGNLQSEGMVAPFGIVPVPDAMSSMSNDQSHLGRGGQLGRVDNGSNQDRRGLAGPVMGAPGRSGYEQSYGGDAQAPMTSQQMPSYSMPAGQNGMPMYSSGSNSNSQGLDWSIFQTGAQETYANAFSPNIGQTQIATKPDSAMHQGSMSSNDIDPGRADDISGITTDSLFFGAYDLPTAQDPFLTISNQILNFFYPPGSMITNQTAGMNLYFSAENIKDFLEKYTHFHIHFPMIHTPTFRIMEAYTGLLAGLCCVGACYSDRVEPPQVREMMDFLKEALERDSQLIAASQEPGPLRRNVAREDIEEIQAFMVMAMLHVWNGTPQQREQSRQIFPKLSSAIRKVGLLNVSTDSGLHSPLHQRGFSPQNFDVSRFDWDQWVEQEKRIRIAHIVHLGDIAMSLYFNMSPALDPFEISIPLPSDDVAWDARTSIDCAVALGLHGQQAAQERNPDGTRHAKQPEVDVVLQTLLHPSYQIQPGSTNLYGKFILIHNILALVRKALVEGSSLDLGTPPMSDWMVRGGGDANSSGRATPVEGVGQQIPPKTLKMLCTALDKFKVNWDADMATQFPPNLNASAIKNPRRYGFSRDGIHFYWLAKYMLKHTRPAELQMVADARLMRAMQLLKSVKAWVMTDGASRGEELGSVGDIDKDYGVQNLTLDMASLFKPLPKLVDDPRVTSVKTDIGV